MNHPVKVGILIGIVVAIGLAYFILKQSKSKQPVIQETRQITFEQLESVIEQLQNRELEYDFFGITSNGTDCIYFTAENGGINIEFEVMTSEQQSFVKDILSLAKEKQYPVVETTYVNQSHHVGIKESPVYKIQMNANPERAAEVGIEIMRIVFHNNETTKFDIVP